MQKTIALVAHDHKKDDLLAWAKQHLTQLQQHKLVATGTTGGRISEELNLPVHRFKSGPLGGDQQIGALIAEGNLDCLIFFYNCILKYHMITITITKQLSFFINFLYILGCMMGRNVSFVKELSNIHF